MSSPHLILWKDSSPLVRLLGIANSNDRAVEISDKLIIGYVVNREEEGTKWSYRHLLTGFEHVQMMKKQHHSMLVLLVLLSFLNGLLLISNH